MSRYMFRRFDDTCNYKNNQNKKIHVIQEIGNMNRVTLE